MDILFYMPKPKRLQSHGMRTHIIEVLSNLHRMGHSIRFADGELYTPDSLSDLHQNHVGNIRKSVLARVTGFAAASPLKGETWLIWNFFKEARVFFSAMGTVMRHKPEIIYWRESHFNSDYLISRLFGIPLVKEVNTIGTDEIKMSMRADKFTRWLYKKIQGSSIGKAERIIVVTPEMKTSLQTEHGVAPDKITVIQNGANIDLFRPMDQAKAREKLGLNRNAAYVIFVGLLREWQGVEYLIRSLPLIRAQHPEAQLLIVGDGPLMEKLRDIAVQIGEASNVIFTGGVSYEDVPFYINASDVCAAPFVAELNKKGALCSLKMHEYLACGKPCVISKLDGVEATAEDHCLVPVEPENVVELAAGIASLLKNGQLRKQMGENGRKYIVQNHSWEKVTERVAEVLCDASRLHALKNKNRNSHEYKTEQ